MAVAINFFRHIYDLLGLTIRYQPVYCVVDPCVLDDSCHANVMLGRQEWDLVGPRH